MESMGQNIKGSIEIESNQILILQRLHYKITP